MSVSKESLAAAVDELTENFQSLGNSSTNINTMGNETSQENSDEGPKISTLSQNLRPSSSSIGGRFPKENDEQRFERVALEQLKALQTAISVPLFSIVHTFEGDPKQFKQWCRNIERYAQMARLNDSDIPQIVNVTCTGLVADFVKKYIEECSNSGDIASWAELKKILQRRFGEINDQQQAMAILRQTRQKSDESVQMYAQRMLRIAEDAYPAEVQDTHTRDLVQKQLADMFIDGLYFDYLRLTCMRSDPKTFEDAVNAAMKEQGLRQRFHARANVEPPETENNWLRNGLTSSHWLHNQRNAINNQAVPLSFMNQIPAHDNRAVEPMEIGHIRRQLCYRCADKESRCRECNRKHNYRVYAAGDSAEEPMLISDDEEEERKPRYQPPKQKKSAPYRKPQNERRPPPPRREVQRRNPPPVETPEWIRGAECWICHMIGHLQRNCPRRNVPERNRERLYPRVNQNWRQSGPRNTWPLNNNFRNNQGN